MYRWIPEQGFPSDKRFVMVGDPLKREIIVIPANVTHIGVFEYGNTRDGSFFVPADGFIGAKPLEDRKGIIMEIRRKEIRLHY